MCIYVRIHIAGWLVVFFWNIKYQYLVDYFKPNPVYT